MSRTEVDVPPGSGPPPKDGTVWERFSFLGMQTILVLYFADTVTHGSMGMSPGTAASVSAAISMTLGLIQYVAGRRQPAGRRRAAECALTPDAMRRTIRPVVAGTTAVAVLAVLLTAAGRLTMDRRADLLALISVIAPVVYFFLASTVFYDFPASWYACALGAFAAGLAPVVAALWARMGHRRPHASNKIATGMVLSGLSFLSPALANGIQAQTVKLHDDASKPARFGVNGVLAVAAGLAAMAAAPRPRRTMHPVH